MICDERYLEKNFCILVVNISVNSCERNSNWDHVKSRRAGEGRGYTWLHSNLHILLPHTVLFRINNQIIDQNAHMESNQASSRRAVFGASV